MRLEPGVERERGAGGKPGDANTPSSSNAVDFGNSTSSGTWSCQTSPAFGGIIPVHGGIVRFSDPGCRGSDAGPATSGVDGGNSCARSMPSLLTPVACLYRKLRTQARAMPIARFAGISFPWKERRTGRPSPGAGLPRSLPPRVAARRRAPRGSAGTSPSAGWPAGCGVRFRRERAGDTLRLPPRTRSRPTPRRWPLP